MITLWTTILRQLSRLKNLFLEELWILGLLLPVIAIGIISLVHFSPNQERYVAPQLVIHPMPKLAPNQLSDKQVAAMVQLPLDQLINIPVYSDKDHQGNTNDINKAIAATNKDIALVIDKSQIKDLEKKSLNANHSFAIDALLTYQIANSLKLYSLNEKPI